MRTNKKAEVTLVSIITTTPEINFSNAIVLGSTKIIHDYVRSAYVFCYDTRGTFQGSNDGSNDLRQFRAVFLKGNKVFAAEAIRNLKDIPIFELRHIGIRVDGKTEGLTDTDINLVYDLRKKNIYTFEEKSKELAARLSGAFHFAYPCIKYDGYIYPTEPPKAVKTECNFDVFWKSTTIKNPVPGSRIDSVITYVPDGEFYIVYGGIIGTESIPKQQYTQILDELKVIGKRSGRQAKEVRKSFKHSYFLTDEVWKFHIKQEEWELASPATYFRYAHSSRYSRPSGIAISAHYHSNRKKIYYLCDWSMKSTIFEFDCQSNEFEKLFEYEHSCYDRTKREKSFAIDYMNDTLLIPARITGENLIMVFCLVSHQFIKIELSNYLNIDATVTDTAFLFWECVLIECGEKLLLSKADGKFQYTAWVDWSVVRITMVKAKLDKIRREFHRANLEPVPGKLSRRQELWEKICTRII